MILSTVNMIISPIQQMYGTNQTMTYHHDRTLPFSECMVPPIGAFGLVWAGPVTSGGECIVAACFDSHRARALPRTDRRGPPPRPFGVGLPRLAPWGSLRLQSAWTARIKTACFGGSMTGGPRVWLESLCSDRAQLLVGINGTCGAY